MSGDFTLTLRIAADGRDAANGLRVVSTEVDHLSRSTQSTVSPIRTLNEGFGSLAGAAVRLAGLVGAGLGLSELASSFMEANRAAGTLRASLETVMGSTQDAALAWGVLQEFANQTPYTLNETVAAFTKLKSMGLDPGIEALTSYGNTAGAMGKSLNQMIEAVADAATGEFEQLKEFGIKASKQGDTIQMTFQGVTTSVANNAQAIEGYLQRIGNVEFAGGMERQSQTLSGVISTLSDAWDALWVQMGDSGLTQGAITVIKDLTTWLEGLAVNLTQTGDEAGGFKTIMADLGAVIAQTYNELKSGEWSATTTAIAAATGAVAGIAAALLGANVAIQTVTLAMGVLTAVLSANPWTLALAAIAAVAGALYALRDQTVTIGDTTATVGAWVGTLWEQTVVTVQAAWQTFLDWIAPALNAIGPVVSALGSFVVDVWSKAMDALGGITKTAVNIVGNMFVTLGTVIGAAAGEIAVAAETGQFSWERFTGYLKGSNAGEYIDIVGDAAQGAKEEIDKLSKSYQGSVANMEAVNQVNRDYAELERELAADTAKATAAAKAKELQDKLNTDSGKKLGQATMEAAGATNKLSEAQKAAKKDAEDLKRVHDENVRSVEGLINRYLPAEAAAIDYEEAMKALADAGDDVKLSQDQAGLSADQLRVIQQGLQADLQKTQIEAVKAAGGFAGAWVEAAEQLDDTFAGLWRNLISGEGDVLGDLKRNALEWLADLSYQLLLKPLVVPIQGLMMGMAGVPTGVTGMGTGAGTVMGAANTAGGLSSTFSGLSSLASGLTSVFSGAAFTGIMSGFSAASTIIGGAGYFGGFGAAMGLASSAASIGSYSVAIGAAAPYLLPAVIAIGAIAAALGAFDDKKPRYGTLAAQTLGRSEGLEDNEWGDASYSKGGFGLMFGITDKGSKNIKAPEMKETFDALADVSKALEDFFGPKLSAEIKDYLDDLSNFGDGLLHLTEDEGDLGGAIARLVQLIGQAAGRTTDDIGKAFFRLSGDLGGSVEEVQKQLQTVIAATVMAVQVSENWRGEVGQLLGLTGAFDSDLAKMLSYSKQIQTEDEITAEALLRLIAQMQGLADAAFTTGQSLDGLDPKKLVQIADDLATQFGGVENLTKAVGFYMANFMTAGELALRQVDGLMTAIEGGFANLREDLSQDFANLGEVMPTDWLDQIPQTRAAFVDLVQSLDLTTEAGRVAYKGLMDLAPAFDALFDAVENFQKWIDPAGELERATVRVEAVFKSLGLEMPNTYEALQQLYRSGALSAEQMAVLAAILGDLDIVFKQAGDGANVLTADMWGLSGAFAQAMEAITAAIADTRSQISDFGLTDAELYDRYLAEARRLQASLSGLDSADQVEEVTRQINDLIRSAWGVLDDAERGAAKDQFIGYLDDLEQAAADRLKAIQDATNAEDEPLMQAAAGFGEAALNFGDAVDGFDASVAALADVVGALDQIQSQQAAYTAAVQNQPAFSTVAAPDTSVYQSMAAALTAAAADLRSAAAEYQKAGATMDGAAKGMTTAGAKIASAAADIPSAIAITVTATGATATVEATF